MPQNPARKPKGKSRSYSKFRSKWWALCRIDRHIRAGRPCTAALLAEELEVDRRTIRRYIAFLREDLGAPIEYNPIDERYELSDLTWTMPNVYLSDKELVALAVATRSLAPSMPSPFAQRLEELLRKLLDALPSDERDEIVSIGTKVEFVSASVLSKGQEWVEPLIESIREQATVEIDYWVLSKQKMTHREVDPYHLRYFAGAWYLVGYDHGTKHLPVFNLARIRSLATTQRGFSRRPFDAADYFRHSFGITAGGEPRQVQVRLTKRAAKTAGEKIWPPGFTYEPIGRDVGILTGTIGKLDDLLAWIAGFDGDAELLGN